MDPCKFCYSGVYTDPSKVYTTRDIWFQAITALSERKVARFGCLHESVWNMEPCRSQSWPAFFRSQTWLNRSKIRPVPPVSCERKVEPCKFLSVQRFVQTRLNGALAVQNSVQFHRSRVNARWNRASFLSVENYIRTRVYGALVSQEFVRRPTL